MEHIKLNKYGSNSEEIEFEYSLNGVDYLIIVDVEYWTIKQDSYGVHGSSWTEVDAESFEFDYHVYYNNMEDDVPKSVLTEKEVSFIEQECINYLNDEYV